MLIVDSFIATPFGFCCNVRFSKFNLMFFALQVKLMSSEQGELAPSRVLHVRHLPGDATELEVAALGAPFGRVVNIMILRQRNQALMEMADEASATALVNYYNYVSANVR